MRPRAYTFVLSLAALGIVFGDIGTSPLYALRECFSPHFGLAPTPENVLGVLSLIIWSLVLIVCVKYLMFVLRADNEGEGGILALLALVHEKRKGKGGLLVGMGLFGAALLYSNGILTPGISVLSAMEGIELAQPAFSHLVLPLTVAALVGLFALQRRGTAVVGTLFGPIMVVWFTTLGILGVRGMLLEPGVLASFNPIHGARFLMTNTWPGFLAMGAVFLTVTGAEAIYADMGHFGKGPIRMAWFFIAFPGLLLNYLGQGALLLARPETVTNPFYNLAPEWLLIPLIVLATMATIIASQAIISGAFSLTMQAVQLGYWPRLEIKHTSAREIGQVYVPQVNAALMIGTIALVLSFKTSSALAGAYGLAVTLTMVITSFLFYVFARERWNWSRPLAGTVVGIFLLVELAFLGANLVKVLAGGWLPIAVALGIFVLMITWRDGRVILGERMSEVSRPIDKFLHDLKERPPTRVRGSAVYLTGNDRAAPPALMKNLEHNRVLHMRVALLSIRTEEVPHVPPAQRVKLAPMGNGLYRVQARYGFMDEPNVAEILERMREEGLDFPMRDTTFFLGRERVIASRTTGMAFWREKLFAFMAGNAQPATTYFRIPPDRVIEVGAQVEL